MTTTFSSGGLFIPTTDPDFPTIVALVNSLAAERGTPSLRWWSDEEEAERVEDWSQDKVSYWCSTGSDAPRKVFSFLAEIAGEVRTTTEIAAATLLPVIQVRAVFAGLGNRVQNNKMLKGTWPIHAQWNGTEVMYSMPGEVAKRWKKAAKK